MALPDKPITVDLDRLTVGDFKRIERIQQERAATLTEMSELMAPMISGWTVEDIDGLTLGEFYQVLDAVTDAIKGAAPKKTGGRSS